MKAGNKDITRLLQLQQIDMDLMRLNKKLEKLPQREAIVRVREKKKEISAKAIQIQGALKESEQSLSRIKDEDGLLALKQKEIQEKIDDVQGDYRAVTSLTRDLEGVGKRRKTLAGDIDKTGQKNSQIKDASVQIKDALETLDKQEAESIASFQTEGGALKNEIARLEALRTRVLNDINDSFIEIYEKKRARYGGIGISKLEGGMCSICRNVFDEGKLFQVKSETPLSECPACKRMMVIIDD